MDLVENLKNYIKVEPRKAAAAGVASVFGLYLLSRVVRGNGKTDDKIKDISLSFPRVVSKPVLTDEEIAFRSKYIFGISYNIHLNL
jgi:hypothetical protein